MGLGCHELGLGALGMQQRNNLLAEELMFFRGIVAVGTQVIQNKMYYGYHFHCLIMITQLVILTPFYNKHFLHSGRARLFT